VQFATLQRGRFSSECYRRPQIAMVHRNTVIAGVVCPERRRRKIKARSIRGRRQRQPTTAGALFVNAKPAILLLCSSVTSSMRIEKERFSIDYHGGHFSVENQTAACRQEPRHAYNRRPPSPCWLTSRRYCNRPHQS